MTDEPNLLADVRAAIDAILSAPCVDPGAPAGYVRPAWAAAETRRRHAAAAAVLRQMLDELDKLGPVIGATAREHFAPVLRELAGSELH